MPETPDPSVPMASPANPIARRIADLRGEKCPYTFIKARLAMEDLEAGEFLKVILDFPPAWERVPSSFGVLGHRLISSEQESDGARVFLFCCGGSVE